VREAFDRRVVSEVAIAVAKACQSRAPAHLAGGTALSGAHLSHRLSRDLDMFCHEAHDVRLLARDLDAIASETGTEITMVRDLGTVIRARIISGSAGEIGLDLVHEAVSDIEPAVSLEGVMVESFADLRSSKLTCILERSEPRDLVDLLFLERAGFPPDADIELAVRKDRGIDPGVLAWLLRQFPIEPLPQMLVPLSVDELHVYRDELAERFRALAISPA